VLAVVNRRELVATQQLRQLSRIDSVTLAAVLQQGVLARIADHEMGDVRFQQVM
jgi:hypothetical protein